MGGSKSKLATEDAAAAASNPTSLVLSKRGYATVPKGVEKTTSLTALDLSANKIAKLKPSLTTLTALATLNLASNVLGDLPSDFAKHTALTDLNLAFNPMPALPPVLKRLPRLADLKVGLVAQGKTKAAQKLKDKAKKGKPLFVLDPSFFDPAASSLPASLTALSLPGIALTAVPPQLANCHGLTSLSLAANRLTELPPFIGNFSGLTSLNVASNKLTDLPNALGKCSRLATLKTASNPLSALPDDIRVAPADIVLTFLRQRGGLPEPEPERASDSDPHRDAPAFVPDDVASDPAAAAGVGDGDGDGDDSHPDDAIDNDDGGYGDDEDVDALAERVEAILDADTESWIAAGEGEGEGEDDMLEFTATPPGDGDSELAPADADSSSDFDFAVDDSAADSASANTTPPRRREPSVSWLAPAESDASMLTREDTFDPFDVSAISDATRAEVSAIYADDHTPSFVHAPDARSPFHDGPAAPRQPTGLFPPRRSLAAAPLPDVFASASSASTHGLRYDTADPGRRQPLRLSPDPPPFRIPNARVLITEPPSRDPYAPRAASTSFSSARTTTGPSSSVVNRSARY